MGPCDGIRLVCVHLFGAASAADVAAPLGSAPHGGHAAPLHTSRADDLVPKATQPRSRTRPPGSGRCVGIGHGVEQDRPEQ